VEPQLLDADVAAAVQADRWLSEVVGTAVFRVDTDPFADRPAVLAQVVGRHVAHARSAMYYAKVATDRVDLVQALSAAGLSPVDVNVTFALDAPGVRVAPIAPRAAGISVDEIAGAQAAEVLEIAGTSFRYSRFHLDPRIPIEVAHRIKREWIRNYVLKQRGERLLVATVGGRPAGFLAILASHAGGKRIRTIDLVAVAPWAQRRGVGRALVQTFVDESRPACDQLQVGTQAANIPSMRLYEALGFSIARTQYVLHGHVSR